MVGLDLGVDPDLVRCGNRGREGMPERMKVTTDTRNRAIRGARRRTSEDDETSEQGLSANEDIR